MATTTPTPEWYQKLEIVPDVIEEIATNPVHLKVITEFVWL